MNQRSVIQGEIISGIVDSTCLVREKGFNSKKNVLVIEDLSMVRETLCSALDAFGFDATGCNDGLDALGLVLIHHYDCVVTDYRMPNMDGLELTKRLRLFMPALFIIGVSSEDRERDFLEAGADAFLVKPYSVRKIVELMNQR